MHPLPFFRYNWKVRDEYFSKVEELSDEEFSRSRTGGLGSIQRTLAHIVLVEQEWIRTVLAVEPVPHEPDAHSSVASIRTLSENSRADVEGFLTDWNHEKGSMLYEEEWNGQKFHHSYDAVVAHVIAHEIHHAGQLSVWLRELEIEPPSADFL